MDKKEFSKLLIVVLMIAEIIYLMYFFKKLNYLIWGLKMDLFIFFIKFVLCAAAIAVVFVLYIIGIIYSLSALSEQEDS